MNKEEKESMEHYVAVLTYYNRIDIPKEIERVRKTLKERYYE